MPARRHRAITATAIAAILLWAAGCSQAPEPPLARHAASATESDPVADALARGKPTVVEFGANACAACRDMKQVQEALRTAHGARIEIVEVDLLKRRDYASRFGVQLMPTQIFFDAAGREIGRHAGRIGADEILAQLGIAGAAQ